MIFYFAHFGDIANPQCLEGGVMYKIIDVMKRSHNDRNFESPGRRSLHHPKVQVNQSKVRSITSPAAWPTTIGEGDLSSRLTDERDCSAIMEFSSAYHA